MTTPDADLLREIDEWLNAGTSYGYARKLLEHCRAALTERIPREKDEERLDWLDTNCRRDNSTIRIGTDMKSCTAWAISSSAGRTLREAIDAALASSREGENG